MQDRDLDELQRIWDLKEKGAISDDEYLKLKSRILAQNADPQSGNRRPERQSQSATPLPKKSIHGTSRQHAFVVWSLVLFGLVVMLVLIGSNTSAGNSVANEAAANESMNSVNVATSAEVDDSAASESPWSYSQDEDKVRGGTTFYATTKSTNSIAQSFPYDSDTTMEMTVRKSPAYGTDVILTISSGQMMCPSYEGCSGTVRFDNGRPQHVRFNGPADADSESVFLVGAKQFIDKLKTAKKVTVEKTLYEAGSPQFEFDVHGLKWDH
jgi:hypothetical protein